MGKFSVLEYSIDNFRSLVESELNVSKSYLEKKLHFIYFEGYFKELDAKTILIERDYVDKDYLEDYSTYYVRSFSNYNRFCYRLHFFSKKFNEESFRKVLVSDHDDLRIKDLQEGYIGFIVVKPLPQTIIGRTCLRTYPEENDRFFNLNRRYNVSLFGIPLETCSIAYQEQDSVVAACASSAVWSAFQATGLLFQHSIPSPGEITKAATKFSPYGNRHFPNKGLNPEQMAYAIRNVGLEPYLFHVSDYSLLKATIYAYQKAHIPLILGVNLIDESNGHDEELGRHAVTVTGYRMDGNIDKFSNTELLLTSSKMEKIYVHDDQVGPFARMGFDRTDNNFSTSWLGSTRNFGTVKGAPEILIIPLYNKIRIPFDVILSLVLQLDNLLRYVNRHIALGLESLEWDITLSTSNDIKEEIRNSSSIDDKLKVTILTDGLPKFVWKAEAKLKGDSIVLVFDATDLEQGKILVNIIPYSSDLLTLFKTIATNLNLDALSSYQVRNLFDKIKSMS